MRGAMKGSHQPTLQRDISFMWGDLFSDGCSIFTYSPVRGRRYLDCTEVLMRIASDRSNGFKTRIRVRGWKRGDCMTPLQVALIGKKMREAQKQWPSHPQQVSIVVAALEKEFDDALVAMEAELSVNGTRQAVTA